MLAVAEGGVHLAGAEIISAIAVLVGALVALWKIARQDVERERIAHEKTQAALVAALERCAELRARVAALEEYRDEHRAAE